MHSIGILGAGTWGIALARMLAKGGNDVTVWSALPAEIDHLSETHCQPNLPGVVLPESIQFTKSLPVACRKKDLLVFAVPSVYVRQTASAARPYIADDQIIVDVAKGIEPDTLLSLTGVICQELQKDGRHEKIQLTALSGPTHAEEVAKDLPTTIVAACKDPRTAQFVQSLFMNPVLRVYTNTDILGVELCGAMKNIIALAAGISDGLGYGDNTKAALITRGMVEISDLGRAMGCQEHTFSGLAGMGDLIVTCTSRHSRNHRAGSYIGQGLTPAQAAEKVGMVVEGIHAIPAAIHLSRHYGVELPIIDAVNRIVNEGADARQAVQELMLREKRAEHFFSLEN